MDGRRNPERFCYRVHGNVVMRRTDPAGREQIIVLRSEFVHRLADLVHVVGHDPYLGEADTMVVEPQRQLRDIPVLGPAGENLIADDGQGRGPHALGRHARPLACCTARATSLQVFC